MDLTPLLFERLRQKNFKFHASWQQSEFKASLDNLIEPYYISYLTVAMAE